jgi:protein-tyrosine phosphatase
MIDIHCHLIPGVDDGCKTIEDSIRLLKYAESKGITDIVCTPHFGHQRGYAESKEIIQKQFDYLTEEKNKHNININLYLGREIDATEDIETLLKENKVETLNNTNYVLIDFGMEKENIDEICYNLVIANYIPIIAHPERYRYVETTDFHKWKKTGALIQMNATSLFHTPSKDTRKKAKYLLKNNLIDILASDTHKWEHTYDEFLKVTNTINKKHKQINLELHTSKMIKRSE